MIHFSDRQASSRDRIIIGAAPATVGPIDELQNKHNRKCEVRRRRLDNSCKQSRRPVAASRSGSQPYLLY